MDTAAWQRATGLSADKAAQLLPGYLGAAKLAGISTVEQHAQFIAQVREESANFNATQEYGDASYFASKSYHPFIGRTFIQITWDYNYKSFGAWAHSHGLVDDPDTFYKNPASLADQKWAWYGPAWYWQAHNLAGVGGDVTRATQIINGGDHGLATRQGYYTDAFNALTGHDISMGDTVSATGPEHWDAADWAAWKNHIADLLGATIQATVGNKSKLSVAQFIANTNERVADPTLQGTARAADVTAAKNEILAAVKAKP